MITEKTKPTATPVMKAIIWLKRTITNSTFLPGLGSKVYAHLLSWWVTWRGEKKTPIDPMPMGA